MHYDVTIGIPVFQVEEFIGRTMESVLSQTYPNIEFLIIDDGSKDNSVEVVRSFMGDHPRGKDIRLLIHESNKGVSETRNHIIEEAQGDYLIFVDSDDMIAPDTISILVNNVRRYNADVAFGSYERIELDGERKLFQYPKLSFSETDSFVNFVYRKYAAFQASACNYLMRISLVRDNNLRFYKSDFWEDMVFTLCYATIVKRAVLLPDITYTYLCRENSLSNSHNNDIIPKDRIMQYFMAIESLKDYSLKFEGKPYYSNMCYFSIMSDIYIICNILKKKHYIVPSFSNNELHGYMRNPLSFSQLWYYRQMVWPNLILISLSKIPALLDIFFIRFFARLKGLL